MKRFLPYLLPVISLVFLVGLFLTFNNDSTITGFAVAEGNKYSVNSDVKLNILDGQTIPGNAFMIVNLDDREAKMKISDFVVKAGGEKKDSYEGKANYVLKLSDFEIDNKVNKGEYVLSIKLEYNGDVISESNSKVNTG